jgi:hypothetical protein
MAALVKSSMIASVLRKKNLKSGVKLACREFFAFRQSQSGCWIFNMRVSLGFVFKIETSLTEMPHILSKRL